MFSSFYNTNLTAHFLRKSYLNLMISFIDTYNKFFNLTYCPFIVRANETRIRPNSSSYIRGKGMFMVFGEINGFGGFDMYYFTANTSEPISHNMPRQEIQALKTDSFLRDKLKCWSHLTRSNLSLDRPSSEMQIGS